MMSLAPYYAQLRAVHMSCAAASLLLFALRGIWMMRGPELLRQRWVRIVPHVVDTLLLASAIALTTVIGQYPFLQGWLTAKVLALLGYIVLGSLALKHGRSRRVRVAAFFAAVFVFAYIAATARAHDPLPWRAFLR